jgi:aminopeptidase-like protein
MDIGIGNPQIKRSEMQLSCGQSIYELASRLFPICRSLTGDGVRETLAIIGEHLPLKIHTIPTGTQLFDWQAPQEWLIQDAYIMDCAGRRVVDFAEHNLHVVNFSMPVHTKLTLDELKGHIHTLPGQPDLIPYRTCYHAEAWGFCMSHNALMTMKDQIYEVVIDAERRDGSLIFGEFIHQGETDDAFLLSTHLCHPSLANDNCSGLALLTHLGEELKSRKTRYTYRLLFGPATFGALAWLKQNEENLDLVKHGIVLSCVGDSGGPNYKRSRGGNSEIDRIMTQILDGTDLPEAKVHDFWPYGYDERQFCSPGFDLPVGLFQRSLYGAFPEYHTSADNLDFIKPDHLEQSYDLIIRAIEIAERNWTPFNLSPKGEPQLGRRDLYDNIVGDRNAAKNAMTMLWVLNLADGSHSILDMAERAKLPFEELAIAADRLRDAGLLTAL